MSQVIRRVYKATWIEHGYKPYEMIFDVEGRFPRSRIKGWLRERFKVSRFLSIKLIKNAPLTDNPPPWVVRIRKEEA